MKILNFVEYIDKESIKSEIQSVHKKRSELKLMQTHYLKDSKNDVTAEPV